MSYAVLANRPDADCIVCWQSFIDDEEEIVAHEGLHTIHKICLLKTIERSMTSLSAPTCPYCRKDITDISGVAVDELECPSSMIRERHKNIAQILRQGFFNRLISFPPSLFVVEKMLKNKISITKYRAQTPMGVANIVVTPVQAAFYNCQYRIWIEISGRCV